MQFFFFQDTIIYIKATKLGNAIFIINLTFNSIRLVKDQILYTTLDINHSSDHTTIQTVFFINISKFFIIPLRQFFKNAFWSKIH